MMINFLSLNTDNGSVLRIAVSKHSYVLRCEIFRNSEYYLGKFYDAALPHAGSYYMPYETMSQFIKSQVIADEVMSIALLADQRVYTFRDLFDCEPDFFP